MNKHLERANAIRSHFAEKRSKKTEVEIPEWGFSLFAQPLNLKEYDAVYQKAVDGASLEDLVDILIAIAKDEDGQPAFKVAERPILMNEADPEVIIRVVTQLQNAFPNATGEAEVEEAKN